MGIKHGLTLTPQTAMHHPAFWKALSAVLFVILLIQLISLRSLSEVPERIFHNKTPPEGPTPVEATPSVDKESVTEQHLEPTAQPTAPSWTYEYERDRNNHGLSTEQCDSAFPELYNEIDRAVEHWKDRKITPASIELPRGNDGGVRILIHDQQLRIISTKGLQREDFRHRIIAVLQQLLRALTAAEAADEPIPDTEFTIIVDDKPILHPGPSSPLWGFTRSYANPRHDDIWLIPDFHFFGAPPEAEGFRDMQKKSRQHDGPLIKKIPKVAWRGVSWTNPEIRKPLLQVTKGKKWADVMVSKTSNQRGYVCGRAGTDMAAGNELGQTSICHSDGIVLQVSIRCEHRGSFMECSNDPPPQLRLFTSRP